MLDEAGSRHQVAIQSVRQKPDRDDYRWKGTSFKFECTQYRVFWQCQANMTLLKASFIKYLSSIYKNMYIRDAWTKDCGGCELVDARINVWKMIFDFARRPNSRDFQFQLNFLIRFFDLLGHWLRSMRNKIKEEKTRSDLGGKKRWDMSNKRRNSNCVNFDTDLTPRSRDSRERARGVQFELRWIDANYLESREMLAILRKVGSLKEINLTTRSLLLQLEH